MKKTKPSRKNNPELLISAFDVRIAPDEPVYVIGVASRLVDIPVWTLRQLDKAGVVSPRRMGKKNRFYSPKDIKRLEYVHYLMEEKHVNISGIKIILEMDRGAEDETG